MKRRIFKQDSQGISSVCFPDVCGRTGAGQSGTESLDESAENELLKKARQEAESIRLSAFEEGKEKVLKLYEEPLLAALSSLTAIKAALENAAATAARENEKEIVRLAVAVAEKVIRRKLENDAKEVELLVERAVQAVPKGKSLVIKVNSKDLKDIQTAFGALPSARREFAEGLFIEASSDVEPGGCIVMTEAGSVNANPARQLELIEERLLKEGGDGV